MQNDSITVRKLNVSVKRKLRLRAASEGHSLEEEVRRILTQAAEQRSSVPMNLAQAIMDIVDPVGGIELDLPPRTPEREPPRFDWWDEEEP
jgi:plasmid stability protein